MSALISIAGAALLFVIFGLFRRGRDSEACAGCEGGCARRGACHPEQHSHGRTTDAHS